MLRQVDPKIEGVQAFAFNRRCRRWPGGLPVPVAISSTRGLPGRPEQMEKRKTLPQERHVHRPR
ncbi:hypothetical protein ACTGJ9_039505 [Bradyrhizobium sp. RDM12]